MFSNIWDQNVVRMLVLIRIETKYFEYNFADRNSKYIKFRSKLNSLHLLQKNIIIYYLPKIVMYKKNKAKAFHTLLFQLN